MYYQNYEDYMRNVLGYPVNPSDIYENYHYQEVPNVDPMMGYQPTYQNTNQDEIFRFSEDEMKEFYPEIYHLVSPVVNKVCNANKEPISRTIIERMTEEVYNAVEEQSDIIINNKTKKTDEETNTIKKELREYRSIRREEPIRSSQRENKEQKREERQTKQRNSLLRDLIKILILNRIFGNRRPPRPNLPPQRPPYPGEPGRPPMGPVRPPIIPRDYSSYLK